MGFKRDLKVTANLRAVAPQAKVQSCLEFGLHSGTVGKAPPEDLRFRDGSCEDKH